MYRSVGVDRAAMGPFGLSRLAPIIFESRVKIFRGSCDNQRVLAIPQQGMHFGVITPPKIQSCSCRKFVRDDFRVRPLRV